MVRPLRKAPLNGLDLPGRRRGFAWRAGPVRADGGLTERKVSDGEKSPKSEDNCSIVFSCDKKRLIGDLAVPPKRLQGPSDLPISVISRHRRPISGPNAGRGRGRGALGGSLGAGSYEGQACLGRGPTRGGFSWGGVLAKGGLAWGRVLRGVPLSQRPARRPLASGEARFACDTYGSSGRRRLRSTAVGMPATRPVFVYCQ